MHPNSRLLFEKFALPLFKDGVSVLEIGPDSFPSTYQKCVPNENYSCWHTLDIRSDNRLTYQLSSPKELFPVPDRNYDIVISGQVFEHVERIWDYIYNLQRACKKDGFVITIAPANWPYHEAPFDCWRVFPKGLEALYDYCGIDCRFSVCKHIDEKTGEVLDVETHGNDWVNFFKRPFDTLAIGKVR